MNVMDFILKKVEEETLHMGLIDPDEQSPEEAGELASTLEESGSDAVMVGGSTGVTKEKLDDTVRSMKEAVDLPIILFPTRAGVISQYVDAIYFMSMLNSQDIKRVIGEQVSGAPIIKKMGIEPLPMGYVIVEPGMTVGEVGKADLIPRKKPEMAVKYGLAAQYLGMKLFYLEAGSGAPEPVPAEMVKMFKSEVDLPLIVGGGIDSTEDARKLASAGADIIVTGTVIEETDDVHDKLSDLISAIKSL